MGAKLIAVDGGGSSTRLWVMDEKARVMAEGRGGPSALLAVGPERAARAVEEGARDAGVAMEGGSVALVAITMSGADREPENRQVRERVEKLFPGARVVVEHDANGALLAGTLGGPGALLLSGTGAISLSLGGPGEYVRVGGWGYLIDDIGSGYWLGLEAFRWALRGKDGRGPKTALADLLRQATGVATILDLIGPVHGGEYDRTAVARWAPLVLKAADAGDAVAESILQEAATELALLVGTVIRRAPWLRAEAGSGGADERGDAGSAIGGMSHLDPSTEAPTEVGAGTDSGGLGSGNDGRVPIVTAGGVFAMGPTWRKRVHDAIARDVPEGRLDVWVRNPLVGAAYVALRSWYGDGERADGARGGGGRDNGPGGEAGAPVPSTPASRSGVNLSGQGGIPDDVMDNLRALRDRYTEPFLVE